MLAREDPAHVAVQKTLVPRRMHVVLGIRMQMVMAMLGRPPQHALLQRALRQHREHELERPAGRIGAMREVAVVSGPDGEDARPVEHDTDDEGVPGDAGPDRRETRQVDKHEWDRRRIDDVVMFAVVVVRHAGMSHGCSRGWMDAVSASAAPRVDSTYGNQWRGKGTPNHAGAAIEDNTGPVARIRHACADGMMAAG